MVALLHTPPTTPNPPGRSAAGTAALGRLTAFLAGAPAEPAGFPWGLLRPDDARAVRAWAVEVHPPLEARRLLAALRAALRGAGRLEEDGAAGATLAASLSRPRRAPALAPGASAREVAALMEACRLDPLPAGRRDAAVIAVLASAGARPMDLARLQRGDYEDESALLRTPRAGGGPRRAVVLATGPRRLLEAWLAARGRGEGALFPRLDAAGQPDGPLAPRGVLALLRRRCRQAGVGPLTPGDLRRHYLAASRRRSAGERSGSSGAFVRGDDGEPGYVVAGLELPGPP